MHQARSVAARAPQPAEAAVAPPRRRQDAPTPIRHDFAAIRVLDDVETKPAPAPTPTPSPGPTPAPPAPALSATFPGHIRGPKSPAGTPDRIPPRVDTPVAVGVAGAKPGSPVTLSIDGAGGGNGTATIDGAATASLAADATVQLRGGDQTDVGKARKLRLVASSGGAQLARSEPFSVAAWPIEVGFRFHAILDPMAAGDAKVWGASYDVTVASDSGVKADLGQTKVSENVIVASESGVFVGSENVHSGFIGSTTTQRDHHASGSDDAATFIDVIKKEHDASKRVSHQFFRFSDRRTDVAEDKDNGPKVPTSGFRITQWITHAGAKYFMHTTKEGFANNDVAAGAVDDATDKKAEIKD